MGDIIKLSSKYKGFNGDYICELTDVVDNNITKGYKKNWSYILDTRHIWYGIVAIRVPGRTVGSIEVDDEFKILSVKIDDTIIGSDAYFKVGITEELQQFVGMTLDFKSVGGEARCEQ